MANLINKTLVNRYRVTEFIGRGGMAEVYKVWDAHRSTTLAIKVMHADLALDRAFLRRFKREAQTLARLQHPNIVRFYGLEQDKYLTFMIMDYVEGKTLKHKIFDANGPMPLDEILAIMRPLCQALQYAHNEGFVHADVKPGNVLIDNSGRVMLTDFGIARMTETATVTMIGAGTPAYMSPEQARGEAPTKASDIYALGVLLFEMLTGERPFNGDAATIGVSTSEKVRWEQINLNAPSPRKLNKSLSDKLANAVLKALDKKPANRYDSALDFLNAIEMGTSGTVSSSEPVQDLNSVPSRPPHSQEPIEKQHQTVKNKGDLKRLISVLSIFGIFVLVAFGFLLRGKPATPASLPTYTFTVTSTLTKTPEPTSTYTPTLTPTITITPSPTPLPDEISDIDPTGNKIPMRLVPEGEFIMGDEDNEQSIFVDTFYIDKYEVTNKAYKACVDSNFCQAPLDVSAVECSYIYSPEIRYGKSWEAAWCADEKKNGEKTWYFQKCYDLSCKPSSTDYYGNHIFDDFPVTYITMEMANEYCAWRNGYLPTDNEWEKAARGTQGNIYPWGNADISCELANYGECINEPVAIGSYEEGKSIWGVYDMTGNVMEWINKTGSPYDIVRGGGFAYAIVQATYSERRLDHNAQSYNIGFRCAKDTP